MENQLLLRQLSQGNRVVFKKIFEEYYRPLCGFSRKFIADAEICDDLVQESFLALWNKRSELESYKAIKSYLYSSVRNACLNYLRHESVKQKSEEEIKTLSSDWYSENSIVEEEVHTQIYEAIKELSPQARKVIVMTMNGLTNPEMAEELGVSINTIKTQKQRGYTFLRDKLKGIHWVLLLLLA
ncbi:RNA polymerase sigma-70 factor [Marinifilum flexuosum]|uniref:RNA polymerase sigma-70 factor (ECF subfamily) n=1 Tax=Marinifilum flexuosum TaxID=1117708 RepID=A0A419WWN5_9BACT|nr:RNA polymerase sigma-70 factor [Marinifilum flexuosum]RKD99778.1 RNA polymerase sigma-70 factor (ECF subfamily) [Marinifilum flexuosum]